MNTSYSEQVLGTLQQPQLQKYQLQILHELLAGVWSNACAYGVMGMKGRVADD